MHQTIRYKSGYIHISMLKTLYSDNTSETREVIKVAVNQFAYLIETKSILAAKMKITKFEKKT